jgi:hypothetical protein
LKAFAVISCIDFTRLKEEGLILMKPTRLRLQKNQGDDPRNPLLTDLVDGDEIP